MRSCGPQVTCGDQARASVITLVEASVITLFLPPEITVFSIYSPKSLPGLLPPRDQQSAAAAGRRAWAYPERARPEPEAAVADSNPAVVRADTQPAAEIGSEPVAPTATVSDPSSAPFSTPGAERTLSRTPPPVPRSEERSAEPPGVCTLPVILPVKLHKDFFGPRDSDSGCPGVPGVCKLPLTPPLKTHKDF